ncbi:MAG: MerR family transcriptional regulator [Desulfobacteraceae bacterium]|nr:MerR family transcriptional regulator [Desulfobacteraceae bacterium]
MKSISQIAEELDISATTIREYIKRFNEFFADPVEHEGVKEYPDETVELAQRIHGYYQTTEMTKEEIRVKLGGIQATEDNPQAAVAVASAMDPAQFSILGEKLDHLISVIENLTATLASSGEETLPLVKRKIGSNEKLNEINAQITDIIELSKGGDRDNLEKNVLEADGSIIFSYGRLSTNAADTMNFAKAHKKPWLHIDLETEKNPSSILRKWLNKFEVKVLNVAGKSASKVPGLQRSINDIISLVLKG